MQSKIRFLLTSALTLAALPATAQTAQEPQDSEEIVVSGSYTIPDRIDTATGLGLTTRETPQSVSIVTAQRIVDQNLITVADVINNAVGVSVLCPGLVAGKTQTNYPWDTWKKVYTAEPALWHHEVFRADGTPYRQDEVDYLRRLTGAKP